MFNLDNLNDEYFLTLDPSLILDIRSLSTEDKITCFKYFLTSDCISNVSVIANIFMIINGATDIDSENTDGTIFFNDLAEYVDIKIELSEEIDLLCIKLLESYLSVLMGLDVHLAELKVHILNTCFNLLYLVSPLLISKLMNKYITKINLENVKPAHNADKFYSYIHKEHTLMNDFIQSLMGEVVLNEHN